MKTRSQLTLVIILVFSIYINQGLFCQVYVHLNVNQPEGIIPPQLDDIIACDNETVMLDAGNGYESYIWNTGEETQVKEADTSGDYIVKVYDVNNCVATDTVKVVLQNCASLDLNALANQIIVYPVPTNGVLNVGGLNFTLIDNFVLYNNIGELIKVVLPDKGSTSINISFVPPGIYFLKISLIDTRCLYKKVIIN